MANIEVAQTIAKQLGGTSRLTAMLGAKNFSAGDYSLTFRFTCRAKDKINCIRITLNSKDLYDIEYLKIQKMTCTTVDTEKDIYDDMMKNSIEQRIGLYLSL